MGHQLPERSKSASSRPPCTLLLVAGLSVLAACQPAALGSDAPPPEIDAVFADMDSLETPGCTAAASRDGQSLFEGAWGMANLELEVSLEPDSVFYAGSVSKQFTNAAVALLALRGELDLDDPVVEWFPELRYEQPITVRHLIHHTSGIRDYFGLMQLAGWPDRAYVSNAISLELLTHQRDLNFEPGTEYLYSNSGYMLLAELVERADGRTLREFAAEEIFEPLAMEHSRFEDDYRTIVPGRASSYGQRDDGAWFRYLKAFDGVGSGGMLTTAGDLLLWNENFHDPVVGGQELVDLMLTRGVLADGEELDYAFGLDLGEYRGLRTVGHGGSLKGFRTALTRFPGQRFSVAVLCNFAGADPGEHANEIADFYLADELEPAPADTGTPADDDAARPAAAKAASARTADDDADADETADEEPADDETVDEEAAGVAEPTGPDVEALDRYTGRYEVDGGDDRAGGSEYTVVRREDRLLVMMPDHSVARLRPLSDDRFRLMGAEGRAEFILDERGTVTGLRLHRDDEAESQQIAASRRPGWDPGPSELAAYAGEYESDELQVTYRITATDAGLALRIEAGDHGALLPVRPGVMLSELGTLRFEQAEGQVPNGFRLDAGRVREVAFRRR